MKKVLAIIVLIFVILFFSGCLGSRALSKTAYYEDVDMPGVSKEELYGRISMWFFFKFRYTLSFIQSADNDAGVITGVYVFNIPHDDFLAANIRSTMTIEIKDENYSISIKNADYQIHDESNESYKMETALIPVKLLT